MNEQNDLITINNKDGINVVDARELYVFLGGKREFATWIKNRIEEYGFVENEDFEVFDKIVKNSKGGRPTKEYAISLDTAKELAMVERNEKGRQARRYFIEAEKQLKKLQTNPLLIDQNVGAYPEKSVLTIKMGNYSNQIYVIDGIIFAKLAPIARMMGQQTTPTHLLNRWGLENSLKVTVGKQEQWFINVLAFSEWVKISNRVPYGTIATIYKDVFNIDRKKDEDNPYTYFFTDSEMNEILFSLFKKPINKDQVVELLTNGKINKIV